MTTTTVPEFNTGCCWNADQHVKSVSDSDSKKMSDETSSSAFSRKRPKEDPIVLFERLYKKAQALGLNDQQISKLRSLKKIKKSKSKFDNVKKYLNFWLAVLFGLLAIAVGSFVVQWPWSRREILSLWFQSYETDIDREECIVNTYELMMDSFRPPVDCSVCAGITQVDHVSNISPKEFEEQYAYSGRPVVIVDGAKNWTATDVFSWDFFRTIYSEDSPALENVEQHCQFFPYKTDFRNLREVFNMSEERASMKDGSAPWYIGWSNCDASAANILRKHYQRPYFLPRSAESSKTDWIFMGSPGYGAHLHIDHVGNPSWQAQVTGTKQWTLEPPPECYDQCTQRLEITMHPGEIIVVDTNRWFHSTLNVGEDISICIGSEYD